MDKICYGCSISFSKKYIYCPYCGEKLTPSITPKTILKKLENMEITQKNQYGEQKELQFKFGLWNFGVTYTIFGLSIILTYLATIYIGLWSILWAGFLAMIIGSVVMFLSPNIVKFILRKKNQE